MKQNIEFFADQIVLIVLVAYARGMSILSACASDARGDIDELDEMVETRS